MNQKVVITNGDFIVCASSMDFDDYVYDAGQVAFLKASHNDLIGGVMYTNQPINLEIAKGMVAARIKKLVFSGEVEGIEQAAALQLLESNEIEIVRNDNNFFWRNEYGD